MWSRPILTVVYFTQEVGVRIAVGRITPKQRPQRTNKFEFVYQILKIGIVLAFPPAPGAEPLASQKDVLGIC